MTKCMNCRAKYADLTAALKKNPPLYMSNYTLVVDMVEKGERPLWAFFSSTFTLAALARDNCNVTIVEINEPPTRGSFPFRKTTGWADIFTKLSLNFGDRGYYLEHLEKKYRFGRKCRYDETSAMTATSERTGGDNEETNINLGAFAGMLGVVAGGLLLGAMTLGLEVLFRRYWPKTPIVEVRLLTFFVENGDFELRSDCLRN